MTSVIQHRGFATAALAGVTAYAASGPILGANGQIFIFGQAWDQKTINGLVVAASSYLVSVFGPKLQEWLPVLDNVPMLQEVAVGLTTVLANWSNSALTNANGRDLMAMIKSFGVGAFSEYLAVFVMEKYAEYMLASNISRGFQTKRFER